MTEQEYMLDRFGRYFEAFKGKKIYLYGQKSYTQAIIESYHDEYRFAAVLSDADASGAFRGVPLIHVDALESERPDLVILSEPKGSQEPDYLRIHEVCERCGIPLWDMYGLDELAVHRELATHEWQSHSGLLKVAEGYDVVSFGMIGTLLFWSGDPQEEPQTIHIPKRFAQTLAKRHTPMVFLGESLFPKSVYIKTLVSNGIVESAEEAERVFFMRGGEDMCFRTIREMFPGKRILHFGPSIAGDGIIPRFYDIDTYLALPPSTMPNKSFAPKRLSGISGEQIYRDAIAAIDRNQIVSFDVFDTLLIRKTLFPEDVFELTERRALERGVRAEGFARSRKEAQQRVRSGKLTDIYETMRCRSKLSDPDALMALELETERSVTGCRRPVVELYRYALERGKRVVLTSDMYMPKEVLGELLKANGITGWEKLFVSCEYKCAKWEGLFEELKELRTAQEGIVHIGDNLWADIQSAQSFGLEAVYIPSALDLARQNGWDAAIESALSLPERCAVGLSIAFAFENPFQTHAMKDMTREQRFTRFGYVLAPLITGYMAWLADRLAGRECDGMLFSARDGWLLNELYPILKQAYKPGVLPDSIYLYSSRRAAALAVAAERETINEVCSRAPGMDNAVLMQRMLGIDEADVLPAIAGESRLAYVRRHMVALEKSASRYRAAHLRYFEKCGLKENGKYAFFDFISRGTVQHFLKKFVPFELYGFNMGYPLYATNESIQDIEYYSHCDDAVFIRNYLEIEAVMMSPEPSVLEFSQDGTPIFAEEVRPAERLREMDLTHAAIRKYVSAYFGLFYFPGDLIRSRVPEEIYAADGYHWVFDWICDDWENTIIGE